MASAPLLAFTNARVLTERGFADGRSVLVEGERIVDVVAAGDPRLRGARQRDLAGALLLPGFIDVQVNGGGGFLFNETPTLESLRSIGAAHRRFGTAAFLPTLISDSPEAIGNAIEVVRAAMLARVPGVIGIHIEGPHINVERKGTHDATRIRPLDEQALRQLASLGRGRTLVTLAPEKATPAAIRELAAAGVLVAAGHTNATYDQMQAAFDAGATGITHLFNAMSQMTPREPGVVGAALARSDAWCGIIVDGKHVHPANLRMALAARGTSHFLLVTDAMSCVGDSASQFMLQGKTIYVRDGVCVDDHGVLSGSALDMARAVRNTVELLQVPLDEAVRMASTYPAQFLGMDAELGSIAPGYRASFVIADQRMNVKETWIDGSP